MEKKVLSFYVSMKDRFEACYEYIAAYINI